MSERNPDELGVLWEKDGDRGPYMTGEIQGIRVVAFKNDRKKNDKEPDWRIKRAREQNGQRQAPAAKPNPRPFATGRKPEPDTPMPDDDSTPRW